MADIRSIGDPPEKIRLRMGAVKLSSRANEIASERAESIATRYVEIVKGHLEQQDLPWEPLSEDYAALKDALGLDPRTWISTRILMAQVEVTPGERTTTRDGKTIRKGWFGGITNDKMHPRSPVGLAEQMSIFGPHPWAASPRKDEAGEVETHIIAEALERGVPSRGLKARPLFRPSFEQLVAEEKRRDREEREARGITTELITEGESP